MFWALFSLNARTVTHFPGELSIVAVVVAFCMLARIWGRVFDHAFRACTFFFFEVEISSCTLIPLFMPGSVVPWQVVCDLLSEKVPTLCLDSGIVSPLWLHWVKCVFVFSCNLPPALFAEWPGSFTCHCGKMGVEWTLNKSQHTKLTLEKKILPPLLLGFEHVAFQSWVWHSYQQAVQASISFT